MLKPEILLTLKLNQQLFADPRRIILLKTIRETGSLRQAAQKSGISYKTAWDAINEINQLSTRPFVVTVTGGKLGGGTQLTPYAVRFIQIYDLLTQLQYQAFSILQDDKVPLNDILAVTAKLSLQTSARNQIYATVKKIQPIDFTTTITVLLSDEKTWLNVSITQQSIERLKLGIDKTVILLIKAPLIQLMQPSDVTNINRFSAQVVEIKKETIWTDLTLALPSGLRLYVTQSSQIIDDLNLELTAKVDVMIQPEHILVATLS